MKYVLILGSDYRDCKSQLDKIKREDNTKYPLVTKAKHLNDIPFTEVIVTSNAKLNPEYSNIINAIKLKNKKALIKYPQAEIIPKPKKETEKPSFVEEPITDEFKEELNNLIEKEEDIIEEIPVEEQDDDKPELENGMAWDEENNEYTEKEEFNKIEEMPEIPFEDDKNVSVDDGDDEEVLPEDSKDEELEIDKGNEYIPEDEEDDEPEEEVEDIKPVGDSPRGWHLRLEFIDEAGNIFHKGKYVGKENTNE